MAEHAPGTEPSIFRPLQIVVAVFLLLVLSGVGISAWLTAREQDMLSRAGSELRQMIAFEEAQRLIELQLMANALGGDLPNRAELVEQVDHLLELCPRRSVETQRYLIDFRRHVLESAVDLGDLQTFAMFREIAELESREELRLLAEVQAENAQHRRYELAAPAVLLGLTVLFLPLTWWRIVRPLEDFGRQIGRLAHGDFTPKPLGEIDELTLPLHRSFLKLALRLQELEESHRLREASLEEEVRAATAALLGQQRSLARAERLAATGELAASVAHEVRNPLAGIQMSLANVRAEIDDPDLAERLDLVMNEVVRLGRLVGELVDSARHNPEAARRIDLADLVDELISLTRYQLPPSIQLESRIEESLTCLLPAERLRQALLNLVLNAASAIGQNERGQIAIEAVREGEGVTITVSDDGSGFPDDVIAGGARPFVSTREQGTGLGLAMVRRFTRDLEGRLVLENREGGGARVTLHLPNALASS